MRGKIVVFPTRLSVSPIDVFFLTGITDCNFWDFTAETKECYKAKVNGRGDFNFTIHIDKGDVFKRV